MAKLIKKNLSKWIQLKARKPISVEDETHESEISVGEVFALRLLRKGIQLVDGEGREFHAYDISDIEARDILDNSERILKQPIDVKSAWQIIQAIYFPKLKACKFKSLEDDDGVAGYWELRSRTLALDFSEPDWIGNLIHEMCHQELEEVRKVKQEHTHDKHFQKLARQTNAKIYDLASETSREMKKANASRKPLGFNGNSSLPKFIVTVEDGKLIVCASILSDSNLNIYAVDSDGGILSIHKAGQFKATPEDVRMFKSNFKGDLKAKLIRAEQAVIRHLESNI